VAGTNSKPPERMPVNKMDRQHFMKTPHPEWELRF